MHRRLVWLPSLALVLAIAGPVRAQVIDFESIPGVGTPTEGMAISTQFLATYGVSFSMEGGGFPMIAQVGSPRYAFQGVGGDDGVAPGQSVGSYFLTDDIIGSEPGDPPVKTLIVTYAAPVSGANGVIIDLDGDEIWTLTARGVSNNILSTVILNGASPNSGNGLATQWSFSHLANDIFYIYIDYTGGNTTTGLAFDNFDVSHAAVPEPSACILALIGIVPIAVVRRIQRRSRTERESSRAGGQDH